MSAKRPGEPLGNPEKKPRVTRMGGEHHIDVKRNSRTYEWCEEKNRYFYFIPKKNKPGMAKYWCCSTKLSDGDFCKTAVKVKSPLCPKHGGKKDFCKKCVELGVDNPNKRVRYGLCQKHGGKTTCTTDGCKNVATSNGLKCKKCNGDVMRKCKTCGSRINNCKCPRNELYNDTFNWRNNTTKLVKNFKRGVSKTADDYKESLGCSIRSYAEYLESKFNDDNGFTWDNMGEVWQIDHIIPFFPLNEETTQQLIDTRKHYTNTQPITILDNMSKSNKTI